MWIPASFGQAFPLALVSLFCWGSWSNTAKEAAGLRGVPFAHFYTDWACSCVLTALAAWVTLGAGRWGSKFKLVIRDTQIIEGQAYHTKCSRTGTTVYRYRTKFSTRVLYRC
eukprot:SAG31_NODE_28_length_32713_cov_39.100509_1_plen_112_part_00